VSPPDYWPVSAPLFFPVTPWFRWLLFPPFSPELVFFRPGGLFLLSSCRPLMFSRSPFHASSSPLPSVSFFLLGLLLAIFFYPSN